MRRVRERHLRTREDIAWAARDREYRRALELRSERIRRDVREAGDALVASSNYAAASVRALNEALATWETRKLRALELRERRLER